MASKDEQIRAAMAEQAAEWFVSNDEEPLDSEASAALVAWLTASPVHVEEFLGVAAIARDLHKADAHPESTLEGVLARADGMEEDSVRSFWSHWQPVAIATVAVATLGLLLWKLAPVARVSAPTRATALHFETRHGELKTYRLADSSVLHLNTDTSVTVRYSLTQRLIVLTSGEAAFEVVHEPQRPLRVLAGPAQVVDLGTKFNVRLGPQAAVVTVLEGRVAVAPPTPEKGGTALGQNPPPRAVQLGPNQQLSVTEGEWPATAIFVDAQRATSWMHRQIAFDHEPLERVATEFNRYATKPIEITAPALRGLEVSGIFSTDDPEEFIAFLRSLDGVKVEVTATRIRVSQK